MGEGEETLTNRKEKARVLYHKNLMYCPATFQYHETGARR